MKKNAIVATAAVAATLVLAGCGAQGSGTVSLGTTSTSTVLTTTTAPAPSTTTVAAPPTTTVATTSTTRPPEPAGNLTGFQTSPYRQERILAVPPIPTVTGIRTARHEGFDRVVFDLTPVLPGAESVRYVDRVVGDGSGLPVAVAGSAFLQVRLEEAQAHTDAGAPTIPLRLQPSLSTIREIVVAGDYEGYVTVALGLSARTSFRVTALSNPARIVVDVRAP